MFHKPRINKRFLLEVKENIEDKVKTHLFYEFSGNGFYYEGVGPYTLDDVSVKPYGLRFEKDKGLYILKVRGTYSLEGYLDFEYETKYAIKEGEFELILPLAKDGEPLYNAMYISLDGGSYKRIPTYNSIYPIKVN